MLTFLTYILVVSAVDYFISGSGSYYAEDVVWETTLNGTVLGDYFGAAVASGDVNGDGYADAIVSAYAADPAGIANAGQAFVFFGTANGISDLDASNANITFNGTLGDATFLWFKPVVGDVNNDSYDDVIIGAEYADAGGNNMAGIVYVFFGAEYANAGPGEYNFDALSYANITFNGTAALDAMGKVATCDFNNDNYTDIITGAWYSLSKDGRVHIFFGAEYDDQASYSFDSLSYANVTFNGTETDGYLSYSLACGNVNNDNYNDVIAGAIDAGGNGQVYVFFGAEYATDASYSFDALSYANITFNGTEASADFGREITISDFNNDSYYDVTVGAVYSLSSSGQLYIFFGANYSDASYSFDALSYANITINGTVANNLLGNLGSISSGDVNNDNYTDIIAGASDADSTAGQAYVFFGAEYATSASYSFDALSYANITFNGTASSNDSLSTVASGDINGDSYADIIIGAKYGDPPGQTDAGIVYIYAYDTTNPAVTLDAPADNSYDTDGDVNFSFTTVEVHPDLCVLWFRSNATNWAQNDSASYSNSVQANIFVNLTDAVYVWNVECNDTANNPAFASANRTLTVDTVVPTTPTLTAPTDTSINPRESISYTCESIDATAGISKWTWTLTKPQSGGTVTKTGGAVGSDTQSFSGDDTNLAGTYTLVCEVEDKGGHKSSTSSAFSVYYSHVTEGAAGEGAGGAAQIDLSTAEETTITEKQGTISTFTLDGTTIHTLKIKAIDEIAGTVTIIIESDPITITLKIGETEEVDVDADGTNDISVTLNKIVDGVADITTKRLAPLPKEEVPTEEVPPTEKPAEEIPTAPEAASKTWQWMLIIVVVIVIGVGYYFMKKKKGYDMVSFEEKKPSVKEKKK